MSQTYAEKRLEVIRRLGSKCSRCGFNDERALQIDHIHGGGVQESKRIGMPKYGIMLNMLKNTPELFHATYGNYIVDSRKGTKEITCTRNLYLSPILRTDWMNLRD